MRPAHWFAAVCVTLSFFGLWLEHQYNQITKYEIRKSGSNE